jgi:hypothetical protein
LLAGHAPHQQIPDAEENQSRQDPRQDVPEHGVFGSLRVLDAVLGEALGELGRHQVRHHHRLAVFRRLQLAGDTLVGDHDLGDLVRGEVSLELAVGHDLHGLRALPPLLQRQDREHREQHVDQVEAGASFHWAFLKQ